MTEEQITTETLETCRQKADEFMRFTRYLERYAQLAYIQGADQLTQTFVMVAEAEAKKAGFALTIHTGNRSLWFELHWPEVRG